MTIDRYCTECISAHSYGDRGNPKEILRNVIDVCSVQIDIR